MRQIAKQLHQALLKKKSVREFQTNLQEMQKAGSVTEQQYHSLSERYAQQMAESDAEIGRLRETLSQHVEKDREELVARREELENLEVRHQVGEIPPKAFQKASQKATRKIERLEARIGSRQRLIEAQSSGDMDNWFSAHGQGETVFSLPLGIGNVGNPLLVLADRRRWPGLAGGVLLLISLGLTWLSVPRLASFSLTEVSDTLFAVGLVGGILALAVSFLAGARFRSIAHLAIAVIALAVWLIVWPSGGGDAAAELEATLGRMYTELAHTREGLYMYLAGCGMLVVSGTFLAKAKQIAFSNRAQEVEE